MEGFKIEFHSLNFFTNLERKLRLGGILTRARVLQTGEDDRQRETRATYFRA